MNILITGGAGFIGSHLADQLLERKYNITVVDNLSRGKKGNIKHQQNNKNFLFIEADILNYKEMAEIFKNGHFHTVFHFAANSDIGESHNNPDIDLENTF